eukprot:scaffold13048_cov68-Phaeocystis_antarctica.AAC.4
MRTMRGETAANRSRSLPGCTTLSKKRTPRSCTRRQNIPAARSAHAVIRERGRHAQCAAGSDVRIVRACAKPNIQRHDLLRQQ